MMKYYTDGCRHLVCVPYSRENLHAMAEDLDIKRGWFHKDHYDIPKRRIEEIELQCRHVSSREIVRIIRGDSKIGKTATTKEEFYLFGYTVCPRDWTVEILWVDEEEGLAKVEVDLYSISLSNLDLDCTWEFDAHLAALAIEGGAEE